MVTRRTIKAIQTTDGKRWVTGRIDRGEFRTDIRTKYYKKKVNALRTIRKK